MHSAWLRCLQAYGTFAVCCSTGCFPSRLGLGQHRRKRANPCSRGESNANLGVRLGFPYTGLNSGRCRLTLDAFLQWNSSTGVNMSL